MYRIEFGYNANLVGIALRWNRKEFSNYKPAFFPRERVENSLVIALVLYAPIASALSYRH